MALSLKVLPTLEDIALAYEQHVPRIILVLTVTIFLAIIYLLLNWFIKKRLSRNAKNERQLAQVRVFMRLWRYFLVFLIVLIIIFTYTQSLTALGLSAGFIGAALGWALQTPITGIAAWLMVLLKKPFQAGDRIIIDNIQGDVYDITLSHVILEEFGGTASGDERSGRFIMIPTATLWSAKIVNFTLNDEFVLREVPISITYESNIDRAIKMIMEITTRHSKEAFKEKKVKPVVRVELKDSWVDLRAKYYVHVRDSDEISSLISKEFFDASKKVKDVEIAYPHVQVVMPNDGKK